MKLYTKTGDKGETGLYGTDRVSKAHPRVEAYGTVDELNSLLGVARAALRYQAGQQGEGQGQQPQEWQALDHDLEYLQNALFDLGADLATRSGSRYQDKLVRMDDEDVTTLEAMIDRYQESAPPFTGFVHPGGTLAAAHLQLARAVARRAERETIRLGELEEYNHAAQIYLNRLSDLLFVMARAVNTQAGISEEGWRVGGRR
ncbi:cob(I)yrinic acid a,c-diamide adenosyltransferase [Deinococcus sp. Marseille-Q6407]|uniref:cob(I)yrinic acid a,c-diamide adenosyltransferase n=1 Tax=Deinococcus sp. Marseille-Q6407 TaxID=2969223 RepID=UPI0021C17788|nr:cob(I)yrinic acid a,c-diamide adenosyltransferase [Deinococcus sp. Marseille-Q6407]